MSSTAKAQAAVKQLTSQVKKANPRTKTSLARKVTKARRVQGVG